MTKLFVPSFAVLGFIVIGVLQANAQERTGIDLVNEGMKAYQNKELARSAQLLQAAVTKVFRDKNTLYNTTCSTALAGDEENAFRFLFVAIKAGYRNTAHLKQDSDLNLMRDDPQWAKAIVASEKQQVKYVKKHNPLNSLMANNYNESD